MVNIVKTDTYMGKKIELTENNNNANIHITLLSEEKMREIGFTDFNPERWYFCKHKMGGLNDISFSLTINKSNSSDWCIDILDEDFLQPFDYQYMLEENYNIINAKKVQKDVEQWMQFLTDQGVISGHKFGDYI